MIIKNVLKDIYLEKHKTLKTLKQNTDRVIDVREKPYSPTVAKDHVGATVKIDRPTNHQGKINWDDYFAMVTYNSNTLVESLENGVPVLCDPMCAASPIAETDFSKIETPKYGDRIALFSSLAYNNWNLKEMMLCLYHQHKLHHQKVQY